MSHTEFTTTTNEFIGTAAGHTIGMVIPNIDPEVRTLLKIPEQYSSLGILTSRTGAAAQAFSVDEAAKACNVELLIFELPRDTEGYSGHGNLIVLGAYDVSDARRAVEVALTLIDEKAERIYINEVGHMEMHVTANAGPVLHQIFDAPLGKAFGFFRSFSFLIELGAFSVSRRWPELSDVYWFFSLYFQLGLRSHSFVSALGAQV